MTNYPLKELPIRMSDEQLTPLNDDSPPDPWTPPEILSPIGSLAEPERQEVEQEPGLVIKKGIGRPRKDGMPAKTDSLTKHPTPSPVYKKFYSEATSDNQKPKGFIKWCRATPTWVQDRLTFYVYRDWPTLKEPPLDETGKKEDNKYIDKLASCPENVQEFLDKYGAGDYRMIVNDDVVDKRTIAEVHVREGFRNIQMNPPTDRRIDDVGNVDLESTANRAYVQYLRGKGKLPEQQQAKGRDADMAEANAVSQLTGILREVINKKDDKGQNDTTATVVREMASMFSDANKQSTEMMKQGYETIDRARAQQTSVDPIEYIKAAVELVRPQQVQQHGAGESAVIDVLKSFLEIESRRAEQAEKKADVLLEKLVTMQTNPQHQSQVTAPMESAKSVVKDAIELVQALRGSGMAGGGAASASDTSSSWWKDNLPEIMQYGAGIIQSGVRAYEVSQLGRARQMPSQPQQPQPQQPTYIVPPAAIPDAQQFAAEPSQDPAAEPALQQPEDDGYVTFMAMIHEPLMTHIDKDLGGDQFAQWLIDSTRKGNVMYQQLKGQGAEIMLQGLKGYEPLWRELEPKQILLPKFIDEFMRMEEIAAAAQEVEDREFGGDNEEDGDASEYEYEEGGEALSTDSLPGAIKLVVDR